MPPLSLATLREKKLSGSTRRLASWAPVPALWDAVQGFGSSACDQEIHRKRVATILDGEALRLDETTEGIAVVEPDHPRHALGGDRTSSPVQAPRRQWRDLAIG